ncbi:uncharacterized protein PITG_22982 [Phytophthora infestans T30-4]|uniref:Uncharacterized protein n=1 Tax=Phytophthora infestans (strain T30-4) TaxID=403677 RepID=D0NL90_PHYIT|nr:uncharacterized protein PITG_22982 [Phytophthora infestans T30-4]EEY60408.1 conserved hypothetical protein [Phytophthora infestans T30-4]|eukprot:XP_002900204.1 conserved hypothetical protein [Phytophthora infestans T30-4]
MCSRAMIATIQAVGMALPMCRCLHCKRRYLCLTPQCPHSLQHLPVRSAQARRLKVRKKCWDTTTRGTTMTLGILHPCQLSKRRYPYRTRSRRQCQPCLTLAIHPWVVTAVLTTPARTELSSCRTLKRIFP